MYSPVGDPNKELNKPSKRMENLLEKLADLNSSIYKSMLLKDQFLTIYASHVRATARRNLHQWVVFAINSTIYAFIELAFKFFQNRHFFLNYFLCKITTAISEGINNEIKRLKHMEYGYKDVKYFLIKIHQHCGLLNQRLST